MPDESDESDETPDPEEIPYLHGVDVEGPTRMDLSEHEARALYDQFKRLNRDANEFGTFAFNYAHTRVRVTVDGVEPNEWATQHATVDEEGEP